MVGTGGVYGRLGVVRELVWPLSSAPESRTDLHGGASILQCELDVFTAPCGRIFTPVRSLNYL